MHTFTPADRKMIGIGVNDSLSQMGHIVKLVSDPSGGIPGGNPRANYIDMPGVNPAYIHLFMDLQKLLHDIESEILEGLHPTDPHAR